MSGHIARILRELDILASEMAEEPPKSENESLTRIINTGRIQAVRDILKAISATQEGLK